ncbi:MAG: SGNH/GDSL hydrolase family protein [Chloroflexi bacterium]|nr:SGNH/GDSL hydrolase family protein [Chloroflexota bacterium]
MMSRSVKIGFTLLTLLLIASLGLNRYLYHEVWTYYVEANSVRLDPLGLKMYPPSALQDISATNQPVVLFFGDSRAAGWPAPTGIPGVTFINRGAGGQTSAQVLGRFTEHVLPLKPRVIIIQVGVNDLKTIALFPERRDTIVSDCEANIQEIVTLSLQSGAQVILTTIFMPGQLTIDRRPFWSPDVIGAIKQVNTFITGLQSDRVTVLDTTNILAHGTEQTDPAYTQDFLHLNAAGYEVLNQELRQVLPKFLPIAGVGRLEQ